MNIQAEKLKLIDLLLKTDNPSIIEKIKSLFQLEEQIDIWEELSYEQKNEIEEAFQEVKKGETESFKTFLKRHS